ncbi:hypothetical protein BJV74DRAFT_129976 [Russula compacta]|nr:hypothetical protein BJV74DRAFT_129976 [Russula compacta]
MWRSALLWMINLSGKSAMKQGIRNDWPPDASGPASRRPCMIHPIVVLPNHQYQHPASAVQSLGGFTISTMMFTFTWLRHSVRVGGSDASLGVY